MKVPLTVVMDKLNKQETKIRQRLRLCRRFYTWARNMSDTKRDKFIIEPSIASIMFWSIVGRENYSVLTHT